MINNIPCTLERQALNLQGVQTKAEAAAAFAFLERVETGRQFALGDWMVFCAERFGKDFVNETLEQGQFEFAECHQAFEVASKIPPNQRNAALSFKHHVVAAKTENPTEALQWAQAELLSPQELAHCVRIGERKSKAEIQGERGTNSFLSPRSVHSTFQKWIASTDPKAWKSEDKLLIYEDLKEFGAFWEVLSREIQRLKSAG
jgi:hypothetical protein